MKQECKCDYCQRLKHIFDNDNKKNTTLQQEFEATCFMYENIESALKIAVDKFNGGKPLNNTQKQILAKAIWRN